MGHFLIVSRIDKIFEHNEIAKEYDVGFEINDFFYPAILDDEDKLNDIIERYLELGIPKNSTMHGAFFDLAIFSQDKKIREVSCYRMEQSMKIAKRLGVKSVVFHANYNSNLSSDSYIKNFINLSIEYLKVLLEKYPNINIYMENMFEESPYVLKGISEGLKEYDNYGVCLDYAHAIVYGSSIELEDWITELIDYIKHIHINDNDLEGDLHLPVGSGKINWKDFSKYYEKYFKKFSVLIETNEPDDQRKSLEFLKENLGLSFCIS